MTSLEQALDKSFTFEVKRAWELVYGALKKGIIAQNYEEQDYIKHILRNCQLDYDEMELVMKNWKKVSVIGETQIGAALFKNFFRMVPEVMDYFDFSSDKEVSRKQFLDLGTKMAKKMTEYVSALSDPAESLQVCQSLKNIHTEIFITPTQHVLMREAFI